MPRSLTWLICLLAGCMITPPDSLLAKATLEPHDGQPTGVFALPRPSSRGVLDEPPSADFLGFLDGPNLYAYVRQNPWTAWDPDGLWLREKLPSCFQGMGGFGLTAALCPIIPIVDHFVASGDAAGAGYNTSVQQGRGKVNGCGTAFGIFLGKATGVMDGCEALSGSQFKHQSDGTLKVVPCEGLERKVKGVTGTLAVAAPLIPELLPGRGALTATAVETAVQVERALIPLTKQIKGVADDALVHFAPEGYAVIKPGAGGESHSFRYGDISHLTPRQVETLIGPMARGGEKGGASVMHVLDADIKAASKTNAPFPEYTFEKEVPVRTKHTVQDKQ